MSFDVIPKATKRADGKFLADGVFFLSYNRLLSRGACHGAAYDVMRSLIGGSPNNQTVRDTRVTLTEDAVRRFLRSDNRLRIWWIASRLEAVSSEQYSVIDGFFSYGSRRTRNPTELIFAMLELVARKDKLLP